MKDSNIFLSILFDTLGNELDFVVKILSMVGMLLDRITSSNFSKNLMSVQSFQLQLII